jgi:hypothetical protein
LSTCHDRAPIDAIGCPRDCVRREAKLGKEICESRFNAGFDPGENFDEVVCLMKND